MASLMSPQTGALLYRQMAGAVRNGLSFADLFEVLADESDYFGTDAPLIPLLAEALAQTDSFAGALSRLPAVFPAETVAMLAQAEAAGRLGESLDILADEQADRVQQGAALRAALLWPAALLGFALLVAMAVMIFVVPAFKEVYASFGADLPAPTLLVIYVSDIFVEYWWLVASGLFALYLAHRRGVDFSGLRIVVERLLLGLPFLRNYLLRAYSTRLLRWIVASRDDSVMRDAALAHVHVTTGWYLLRDALAVLRKRLSDGMPAGQALDRLPLLPARLGQQIRMVERFGTAKAVLQQFMEMSEVDQAQALLRLERGTFLTAYVTIGVFVAYMVIALYLPIFKLGAVVG